jgi:DNA-binding beta-propeller fold protein YncE
VGTGNADLGFPTSITLDSAGGKFYYVDFGRDRVSRANVDGTSNEVLIQLPSSSSPRAVTVDPVGGFLYFSDFGTDRINRAPIGGGTPETLVQLPSSSIPLGVTLDHAAGHLYFTDNGANAIRRVNLDGTGLTDLVTADVVSPANVQLDLINGKMYWVDFGDLTQSNVGKLVRANLDGTNVENLLTNQPLPEDISLDVLAGKFYWTDGIDDVIKRANLDGSGVETILTAAQGLDFPFALTVDVAVPEPGVGVVALGAFVLTISRRRRA